MVSIFNTCKNDDTYILYNLELSRILTKSRLIWKKWSLNILKCLIVILVNRYTRQMTSNIQKCYKLLRINEDCSDLELRRAYRKMAKIFHPDKSKSTNNSAFQFDCLNKAYRKIVSFRNKNLFEAKKYQTTYGLKTPIHMPPSESNNIFQ